MDQKQARHIIGDLTHWLAASEREQDEAITQISQGLSPEFVFSFMRSYGEDDRLRIPTYEHRATGIEFNLLPGGSFSMGLSTEEEELVYALNEGEDFDIGFDAAKMHPARPVTSAPFLISRFPLLFDFVKRYVTLDPEDIRLYFQDSERRDVASGRCPVNLERNVALSLAAQFGFTLPSEAQWEYANRGGTKTIFYFGNDLPSDERLEEILLYRFDDPDLCRKSANPFGLSGMFGLEWCEDTYYPDHTGALSDDSPRRGGEPHVVRGGGACFWPWQGAQEWVWCLAAARSHSQDLESQSYAARFVKRLECS